MFHEVANHSATEPQPANSTKAHSAAMTTPDVTAVLNDVTTRHDVLEAFKHSTKLPGPNQVGEGNLAKTVLDMEINVSTLTNEPPIQQTDVHAIIEAKTKEEVEALIDSKLKTAMALTKGGTRDNQTDS